VSAFFVAQAFRPAIAALKRCATFVIFSAVGASACARHYSTTGLVLKVDRPGAMVTISHDAFPGFMDAMAMPFELKGGARSVKVTAGDRVKLRLSVKGGRSWLDQLEVVSATPADAGLQQSPAVPVLVSVGAPIPEFDLVDQTGAGVSLAALKGKVIAVTFIYTRCPLPDYCPRMVENFRAIRNRFAARMDRDLVLLTISFDPKYDTPEMMAAYASANRAGGPGWLFLTGDSAKIARVCDAFGIQYFADEGLITHSLQTAVIDRDGRLAATVEGKDFTPQQLGDLIGAVLDK
jgi:protein SCO1